MPDLTFVLPHWVYWSGLILFPLVAMWFARRARDSGAQRRTSLPIAYFLLITVGFVGLHRFYVRSVWGVIFIPLFLAILYGNVEGRKALDGVSAVRSALMVTEFELDNAKQKAAAEQTAKTKQALAQAKAEHVATQAQMAATQARFTKWQRFSGSFMLLIGIGLLIDVFLLPRLARRALEFDRGGEAIVQGVDYEVPLGHQRARDSTLSIHSRFTDLIDKINGFTGEFIAYWSVIAVFIYYYEVLARYVFNSPTNWAHESMFLMFGMQYLLAGGYALREGAHVRVDVIYELLSDRVKVLIDVVTSVFFFIFAAVLLWTGLIFFTDSISVWEVSFTEWAVQYWPVKFALPLGAVLILLQGISRVGKDILVLTGKVGPRHGT